ncbi:MAG: WhiB family transcriptional regulator [Streptomyces sp.]|nr:WhiB family transcriptional regulator [Streptomyces sp.]NUS11380.1 WhiB family transcriptional regulator [Streptomyces sp.]NUS23479.1 WhiB family transcriptional regulator [Streptomyces sp.]
MNARDETRCPSQPGAGQGTARPPAYEAAEQPADEWLHVAACRGRDDDLFFPVGSSAPALKQTAEAKAICRRCPVTSECLMFAITTGAEFGVWGGLDEYDRRALARRTARGTT